MAFESEEQKQSTIKKAAEISIGLTYTQADSALFTSVFLQRKIDIDVIAEVKAQTICKDGLLEFWSNSEDSKIGGMKAAATNKSKQRTCILIIYFKN